jgi:2-dehydro-3-deoxyphosphogalactonate aldolase
MSAVERFQRHFAACPLVAIIRGVTTAESKAVARALIDGGIRIIEVPLNSPDPFESIRAIADEAGDEALVGAGTVLDPEDVERVKRSGGWLVVSPSTDRKVISATKSAGLVSCPGFFTPSEAFEAIAAGADALKLFPAEAASPKVVKALRAVLPQAVPLLVVGGVGPDSIRGWRDSGADGFGLGSGLYKPGQSAEKTLERARAYVQAVSE